MKHAKQAADVRDALFLDAAEGPLAALDAALRPNALAALRGWLRLHAAPSCELYDPLAFLRREAKRLTRAQWVFEAARAEERVGDAKAMSAVLDLLIGAFRCGAETPLAARVFEIAERQDAILCVRIAPDGPGALIEPIACGGVARLTLDALSDCWAAASSGGKIVREDQGVVVRLSGMRMPPDAKPEAETLLGLLAPGTPAAVAAALRYAEGGGTAAAQDVASVAGGVQPEYAAALDAHGIKLTAAWAAGLPPTVAPRARLRAVFAQCVQWAMACVGESGALMKIDGSCDAASRTLHVGIAVTSPASQLRETHALAAMSRACAACGGRLDALIEPGEALLSVALPDSVGMAIDAWIPGWEAFTARSQQMLRMLKSGAGMPEAEVLGGVLEEELERRLLPRLGLPVARNIARDAAADNAGLRGTHPERLKKAIGQIARDGVKKEICAPGYAGEILWAFRHGDRERFAAGTEALSEAELRALCEALLAQPPRHAEALALVARMGAIG